MWEITANYPPLQKSIKHHHQMFLRKVYDGKGDTLKAKNHFNQMSRGQDIQWALISRQKLIKDHK